MKLKSVAVDNYRMSGVVSPVKTDHVVGFASKKIGNFSFAFVTPLSTDDCRYVRRIGRHRVPRAGLVGWRIKSRKYIKIEG